MAIASVNPATGETLRKIQLPLGDDYALGWGTTKRRWAKGAVLYDQGSNTLNYANVWIAPKIDRVFVAVTNGGSHDDFLATEGSKGYSRNPNPEF